MHKKWMLSGFLSLFCLGCGGGGTTTDGAVTDVMADAVTDVSAAADGSTSSTFACGPTLRCQQPTQYCEVSSGGAKPRMDYQCSTLPAGCGPMPACSCLPTPNVGLCERAGDGTITVRIALP
jgi:hypothetical protein